MKKSIITMALCAMMGHDAFAVDTTQEAASPQTNTEQAVPKVVPQAQPPKEEAPKEEATPVQTNAPEKLDCTYKIPASMKQVDAKLVVEWSTNAVKQAFDLDFNTMDDQLKQLKNCFTDQGWQGFNEALDKSGNLKAIQEQKLTMTNKVDGEAKLEEEKDNQWKVAIPLQVVYQNDKEKVPQELTVHLLVGRKMSGDLGILQMIASPRTEKPATAAAE